MSDKRFSFRELFRRRETQSVFKGFRITSQVVWNLLLIFMIIGLMSVFFVGGAGAGYFASLVKDEPIRSYGEMKEEIYDYEETSEIYFSDDEYLGEVRSDIERREIELGNISQHLIDAVIATEDEYFYEHDGIVPKALLRATYQEFANATVQTGGSTLTQQLIKNQILSSEVSFDRKATEILLAMRLEQFFEKDEILEAYLNVVPFGRNSNGRQIAGAQAASQGLFGVDADELSIPQAAFIAGLPQSPFGYTPFTGSGDIKENFDETHPGINRMRTVLDRMHRHGYISEEEFEEALAYDITENLTPSVSDNYEEYPHITYEVLRRAKPKVAGMLMEQDEIDVSEIEDEEERQSVINEYEERAERNIRRGGYRIHTTINKEIYDAQQKVVEEFDQFYSDKKENVYDEEQDQEIEVTYIQEAGSVLIDNESGKIISFVGGRESESHYNLATMARRSTGSTMKPFTYAALFESGNLQPGFITPDVPYATPNESHNVMNFDRGYRGLMTVRDALKLSRNVPAVREYNLGSNEAVQEALRNNNLITPNEPVYEITPLGVHDISLEDNTNAFATFSRDGQYKDSYMIERIEMPDGEVIYEHESEERDVYSPQTAYLMIDVMRDVLGSGTATAVPGMLNFSTDWAGKTGTTQDTRDAWFVASNPNISMSTWFGYRNNDELPTHEAGPGYSRRVQNLWAELVNAAYEIDPDLMAPSNRFEQPSGIVRQEICGISGLLPSDLCREAGLVTSDLFNADYVPSDRDDSLENVRYVKVGNNNYKALDSTPEEFTKTGVSVKDEYFDFDGDISEYIPDNWDTLVPDESAPDNGRTPDTLTSASISGETLTWEAHPDNDVIGYRIYRASSPDGDFSQIDSVIWDGSFSQSVSSGAYVVTAVDVAGRESSQGDPVISGSLPDEDESEDEDNDNGSDESSGGNDNGNNDSDATRDDEDDETDEGNNDESDSDDGNEDDDNDDDEENNDDEDGNGDEDNNDNDEED